MGSQQRAYLDDASGIAPDTNHGTHMKSPIINFTLALVLCTTALGQVKDGRASTPSKTVPKPLSTIDLYEIVVRYQIKSWELTADSFCLEVNGRAATRTLLERLQPLRVKASSACRENTQTPMMEVVDKETGKMSVIFDLEKIHWHTPSEAEVDGGYVCGSLCMAGGTYYVDWDGSRWIVSKFEIRVQS